jgi:hypothetical protein
MSHWRVCHTGVCVTRVLLHGPACHTGVCVTRVLLHDPACHTGVCVTRVLLHRDDHTRGVTSRAGEADEAHRPVALSQLHQATPRP